VLDINAATAVACNCSLVVMANEDSMDWLYKYSFHIVIASWIMFVTKGVLKNYWSKTVNSKPERPLYRFDQGILNIPLPPRTMWMNMGFWKVRYTALKLMILHADECRTLKIFQQLVGPCSMKC
jgi:hypothetical protein